ncbi:hypothetical protein ETD86_08615 [Nonomuraea turkmeniaca]|uniref:LPXTG cell wall anchor domain-containing protein n=1 Tax=Nonomuraea turkmeniaca TaxID=103838 RepID=A0A5S4GBF8_9ACTN|nr:hypothetical protein [Nonomuraea turkmeniaca]TMR23350.1 hypothetical protein ETD86_08615 [Nonomuraea turkmeniaca]
MARARRLAAAGAVTAFVVAGVSLAAGIGTASASAQTGQQVPGVGSTCLLPLPILCDESSPGSTWSSPPTPEDSWSSAPAPEEEPWPSHPGPEVNEDPWRPAGERQHKVPKGHPETGAGGLAEDGPVWPFALGGAALLTGAGLAGFAVRRRPRGSAVVWGSGGSVATRAGEGGGEPPNGVRP